MTATEPLLSAATTRGSFRVDVAFTSNVCSACSAHIAPLERFYLKGRYRAPPEEPRSYIPICVACIEGQLEPQRQLARQHRAEEAVRRAGITPA